MHQQFEQRQQQGRVSQAAIQALAEAAQGDSLADRAKELQSEQLALVDVDPVEVRYSNVLASLIEAKQEQAARLENRLEHLIEQQASRLQQCQTQQPGFVSLPGNRGKWQQQLQVQQNALQQLQGRLETVREIKDGMGIHGPRVEELAERKLRAEQPELAHEWDDLQLAQRLDLAQRRKLEIERERERRAHARGITQNLALAPRNP